MTDLAMEPGATLVRDIVVYSNAAHTSVLNLTSATIELSVFDAPQGTAVTGLTLNAGIVSAAAGTANMTIDVPVNSDFHVYYYECVLTELDTTVTIIDSGKLVIGQ